MIVSAGSIVSVGAILSAGGMSADGGTIALGGYFLVDLGPGTKGRVIRAVADKSDGVAKLR